MKVIIKILVVTFCIVILFSCSKNRVYSKYQKFDNYEWSAKNKVKFELEMNDTETLHDITLMVRHADSYPYSNLFVFVTSKYPDGKILTDTMEVVLANEKGTWLGSGAGDIFDYKVPIKKNTKFPQKGKYEFTFEQAMRVDPLPLIMDFGFEITKSE
jgi:gliding motility-associated lipoprotein GldH